MLEAATSSSGSTLVGSTGRPRRPAVQNNAVRSVLAESRISSGSPDALSALVPPPRDVQKRWPLLSSWTTPNDTSPRRAASPGGTTAVDTHADSRPAAAGRVPAIGSTAGDG